MCWFICVENFNNLSSEHLPRRSSSEEHLCIHEETFFMSLQPLLMFDLHRQNDERNARQIVLLHFQASIIICESVYFCQRRNDCVRLLNKKSHMLIFSLILPPSTSSRMLPHALENCVFYLCSCNKEQISCCGILIFV